MVKNFFFLLYFLIVFKISIGQPTVYKAFKSRSSADGLSSVNVKKIIKDTKGFFWLGTQDGLNRYDGRAFVEYNKHNGKHTLTGSSINELLIDSANNLIWCFSQYAGIDGIDLSTGVIVKRIVQEAIPELKSTLFTSAILNRDEIIVGSSNGLYRFTNDKLTPAKISIPVLNSSLYITKIVKDNRSRIWLFCKDYGVVVLSEDYKILANAEVEKLLGTKGAIYFFDASISDEGVAFGASDRGLIPIIIGENQEISLYKKEYNLGKVNDLKAVYSCEISKSNELYFSSNGGLFKVDLHNNKIEELRQQNTPLGESWLASVYDIYVDMQDDLWLGCQQGVMMAINNQTMFKSFISTPLKNTLPHYYNISVLNDSTINCSGTAGFQSANHRTTKFKTIVSGTHYYSFFSKKLGLIISNDDGTFVSSDRGPIKIEKEEPGFKTISPVIIDNHLEIGDSVIIIGTQNQKGVILWNTKTGKVNSLNTFDSSVDLSKNIFNYVFRYKERSVFILSDNSIVEFDLLRKQLKRKTIVAGKAKSSYSIFYDIKPFRNYYAVASYGNGVVIVDTQFTQVKEFNTANGLSNNGVYKLFAWKDSLLFVTTNKGLACIDVANNKVANYFESDGLHNSAFEEGCGTEFENRFYAGGIGGFTIVDPGERRTNKTAPLIYINTLLLKTSDSLVDTTNFDLDKIDISNKILNTTISFSAINWNNPERVTFAYRILEQSKEWIDLSYQNFVSLIGLSPGTYHLQVKAANEDGVWSEPKELVLIFLPKWYQTWWFYLLIALTVIAILYALYRYSISQIKKQHEIRKNIATDLHDDLGSTLNSVKVFTNLAISGVKQEESLQQIKDNLNEATMGLRDMIWVLDDSLDTVDELITRLKQFAIPVASASNIQAEIKAESEVNNLKLTKEEKRNLFLVCKEAINNSIKYSGATQINVEVRPDGKKIRISIADNGKGFNVDEVKKGYGLKNMQYRAGQVKYKSDIISEPGKGTRVEIKPG